jgi:hypothetical protein
MTEFSLPPMVVNYDGRWIDVDIHGDIADWAQRSARDVLDRFGQRPGGKREKKLAKYLEGAGTIARRAQDSNMMYMLYPVLGEGVRAIVRFCPVDMSGWQEDEAWPVLLKGLIPDEPWEESPEITEMATPAGTCRRIKRRTVTGEGSTRGVGEQLAYCWVFPQYGAGVVMTTAFQSLQEAGLWMPTLDELALAVGMEQAS